MPSQNKAVESKTESTQKESVFSGLKYAIPIIIIFLAIYGYIFSEFQQVPGPMYGGDYYFHYGIINHIYNGNLPWTCPQFQGEWAFYPWLFHLGVAAIGWLTGSVFESYVLYTPLLIVALTGFVVYFLGKELFGKTEFAVLTTLAYLGTRLYIDYIPANFTVTLMSPLFLLTLLKAYKTADRKWIAAAGVSFGLFSLSHGSALMVGGFFIFLLFAYLLFQGRLGAAFDSGNAQWNFRFDKEGLSDSLKSSLKTVLPIAVIGFVISLLYWGPVLFIYHFKILNLWNEFTQPDFAIYGGQIAKDVVLGYLFNASALSGYPQAFIMSVLTLAGIVLILTSKKDENNTFLAVAFFSGFIGYFHYFITTPLLGTNYAPVRFETFMISPVSFLLGIYAIYAICNRVGKEENRKMFLGLAFAFFLITSAININAQYNDVWTQVGRSPQSPPIAEITDWVEENTDKNAVFLSHDELSFALNGLTGRKVVFERRTHASPYVDINERIADSSVILFGNDSGKTLELLKKYNISYVYWDYNWMATIGTRPGFAFSEPMLTSPKYADYLSGYDVNYTETKWYLDPAWRETYKKYDVLAVAPAKMSLFQPWSDEFAKHLRLVKEVDVQTETGLVPGYMIYQVDYSTF